ncbi:unnamed protein product [Urochloa humidicola]
MGAGRRLRSRGDRRKAAKDRDLPADRGAAPAPAAAPLPSLPPPLVGMGLQICSLGHAGDQRSSGCLRYGGQVGVALAAGGLRPAGLRRCHSPSSLASRRDLRLRTALHEVGKLVVADARVSHPVSTE